MTRRHVTVALSGDGGDELFGGYNRYFWSARLWPQFKRVPLQLRLRLAAIADSIGPNGWNYIVNWLNHFLPMRLNVKGGGEKVHKLALAMRASSPHELYRGLVSQWQRPSEVLLVGHEPAFLQSHSAQIPAGLHYVESMMYMDLITYLPSDILCKVDRASMSASLEVRVPFLDNDLAQFAWNLPLRSKIYRGIGKYPLRCVLERYLPKELFDRPKSGFGIPLGEWLRGPLRTWTEEMLAQSTLKRDGFFRPDVVRQQWEEHLSGRSNRQHSLWSVLMFQSWYRDLAE